MDAPAGPVRATAPTLVYVVDDHAFFRAGVIAWLKDQRGIVCCGEAATLAEARAALARLAPHVLLLDLGFKEGDGLDLLRELRKLQPQTRVIVISQRDETVFAGRAVRAGAMGYLMKSEAVDRLLEAIRAVMRGERYLTRAAAAIAIPSTHDRSNLPGNLASLSDRELQVFGMIGSGLGPKEIAARLSISPKTVEAHRDHIKRKLGAANAATLSRIAEDWVRYGSEGLPSTGADG